ncbi:MAG: nicotinate-nicotinamide nucleotide adenylyltransferase, partial [Planctomycetes bacterium]|nr:nicotinate-nicotinamide nucleotide adenylyltransferase [Planctomycetota bacterium]
MAMTVGILGGSFNPPHRGHLALARTVLDQGLVDEVVLIPAASPPHKPPLQADAPTRLAMSRLLAQEDARLAVSDIELHRAGPSFTVDTVT